MYHDLHRLGSGMVNHIDEHYAGNNKNGYGSSPESPIYTFVIQISLQYSIKRLFMNNILLYSKKAVLCSVVSAFVILVGNPAILHAYTPPIGIPDPGDTWGGGLHPIDTPVPAQPAGWPGSEVEHYYYIDNSKPNCTDSNNRYGFPAKPRCSFGNGTYPAGTYVEFHGNPTNTMQTTFQCTATEPCWIVGRNSDRPVFTNDGRVILTNSSYVFVDGLEFTDKHRDGVSVDDSGSGVSHHISIRNNYAHDYIYNSPGSIFSAGARDTGTVHDIVLYHNKCERNGQPNASEDTDLHCSTFGLRRNDQLNSEAYNLFWLANICNDNGGSGIQVNGWPGGQPHLHHIYLGKNIGSNNRQRMIGVKQSSHVIVSQNKYIPGQDCGSAGCSSESFGWALSPDYVWFIFNTAYEASDGWRSSDASGGSSADTRIYLIGNEIYNIKPNENMEAHNPTNAWRYGQGVDLKNGSAEVYVVDNTFYNVDGGVLSMRNDDNPTHIYGNIFYDIYPLDTFVSFQLNAAKNLNNSSDYNVFFDPDGNQRWRKGSTDYTDLSDWRTATGFDQHSRLIDPKFVNGPHYDFRLQPDSPAIDANNSPRDVYDLFQSLYGINIRVDFNGIPRPQGSGWDMGAFEYDEGQGGSTSGGGGAGGGGNQGTLQPPASFQLVPLAN